MRDLIRFDESKLKFGSTSGKPLWTTGGALIYITHSITQPQNMNYLYTTPISFKTDPPANEEWNSRGKNYRFVKVFRRPCIIHNIFWTKTTTSVIPPKIDRIVIHIIVLALCPPTPPHHLSKNQIQLLWSRNGSAAAMLVGGTGGGPKTFSV